MTPTTISAPAPTLERDATTADAPPHPTPSTSSPSGPSRAHRLWRGREEDPPLVRPALLGLLLGTALLYLWGLGASGWANSFYAAAAQAGSESWKAFFFGSSDAASSITVDKTPLSLWPMSLSIRLFGLSSWSMLVPQALMGVASVGLLYATVRRTTGHAWASLLAGAVLALTPVAVLMFRFNNPDAMLTLLLVGSVYATIRALEDPTRAVRWLALGGALVGLAFLAKMLQAFLVLPPLALVYLLAARVTIGARLKHLLVAFASMVVAAGWWIAIVELWPASSRPYIGGSQDNSILELTLGYNGLGRLNGDETGSVGGGGGWGETGIFRLLTSEIGGQIAWLLPAALALLVLGLWLRRGAGRSDRQLTGLVVWGGWLLVTGLTFSFMAGIFHAYYTVALAPAIAALVGIGTSILWERRDSPVAAIGAGFVVAMTSVVSFVLLDRASDFVPWLKYVVVAVGTATAFVIVLHRLLPRRAAVAALVTALAMVVVGPAAYAVDTAATPHTGSIPSAGPSTGGMGGGPGGGRGTGRPPGAARQQGQAGGQTQAPPQGRGGTGGAGGLLNGSQSTEQIDALLTTDADSYTWAAAAVGSNTAAGYQLATGLPVMAIGGFNGSDPSPTLAQFQQRVADGEIHYFVAGGGFGGGQSGGSSTSTEISTWVAETFTAQTVDGVTLYDLSGGVR
jgi:4-amino-4-deoxy-L-arabinose transferase-like glycosyltransferase